MFVITGLRFIVVLSHITVHRYMAIYQRDFAYFSLSTSVAVNRLAPASIFVTYGPFRKSSPDNYVEHTKI